MIRLVVYRVLVTLPVVAISAILVFCLLRMTPGNPAIILAGDYATPETIAAITRELGLDRSIPEQLYIWGLQLLHGNLGKSIVSGLPVTTMIADRIGPTASLAATTLLLSVIAGVPLGVAAAANKGKWLDRTIMGASVVGFSAPVFVLGYILILIFSVELQWLPVQGYTPISEGILPFLRDIALPTLTLSFIYVALFSRITRTAMLEILTADFIRTAYAKGLPRIVVLTRHALRNAAIPIVSVIGVAFALMIGGVVVTETVFNVPGLGRLIVDAVLGRDYAVIQGVILALSLAYVAVNLVIDLLYMILDPRIKY
ncbi:ABC transporter permease [Bradyrhizobium sp. KB893862 SZCCT0404]|uniref:ABC transporter permease n=1 Tax=Bradyrhizobium sp. KB893862 SZCCT0404 TaxID=2807672 RepID=UPI001BA51B31|nr:ABC transporter permease [Bradyrhizobium sp. KB893862 SZCCT0404]MBR1177156.1 ABC transporter permease [Bradyrhizobium sp. KB893862 SZCCT0404]